MSLTTSTTNNTAIGRFAPSPNGPLHFGSLIAAVGSYLNVKSKGGRWLLRIENIDPPREDRTAPAIIQKALARHALNWDGEILFQSTRHEPYLLALEALIELNSSYPCSCTRGTVSRNGKFGRFGLVYPGSCREHPLEPNSVFYSWRVNTHDNPIEFTDLRLGYREQKLESELGDFIIKRSDGFYAYQLAVVVDDAFQGVTEVVRGEDLLCNTPRQIHLQQLLKLPTPEYLHLPLALDENGSKLSKQNHAPCLDLDQPSKNLCDALIFLGHPPPEELRLAEPELILSWAVEHWDIRKISRQTKESAASVR